MASDTRITEGQFDFSGGVDSSKVPVLASPVSPNGLKRNQLAWLINATVRGGGITQRTGFQPLCTLKVNGINVAGIYQGGWMYDTEPLGGNSPYLMLSIGGRMYQVRVDTDNSIVDVTGAFADPPNQPQAYFVQGEQFMVKQAGDGKTRPLFWDGTSLRRSVGIISANNVPGGPPLGVTPFNELPPATAMVYYMQRIWYTQNRQYCAGDIVGNASSGSAPYDFTDSILKVTESPLAVGGDGFKVPSQAGNIRALSYPIALDTALGEGPLFVFTPKQIYSLTVPVSRANWIATTDANQPLQRVIMKNNGAVGERSIVSVNGDLWYQSLDPAVRSYFMALRYFQTWGNTPVSNPINRVLAFNDRSLMHLASAMEFQSRMYQGLIPVQTPVGVACQMIGVMDLDPLSTLDDQKAPVWEGSYEGLDFLQFFTGNFGGRERAFSVVHSRVDGTIQVWEITDADRFENGDNRVTWYIEFPAIDYASYPRTQGGGPFELKIIDGFDLWVDKVFGTVDFRLQYRVDEDPCLYDWSSKQICAARNCAENPNTPHCYPLDTNREQYRVPLTWGPVVNPKCSVGNPRPTNIGYKFQPVLTIKGWCRVRGYHFHCLKKDTPPFAGAICQPSPFFSSPATAPLPPIPPPPPYPQPPSPPKTIVGYSIDNWAAALAQMTLPAPGTCDSVKPAWDGHFTAQIAGVPSGFANWYFLGQSIGGTKAAADETPDYPGGDWQDNDCYTSLTWSGVHWTMFIFTTCCNNIWVGVGSTNVNDASGVYTRDPSSTSAAPASITVAQVLG